MTEIPRSDHHAVRWLYYYVGRDFGTSVVGFTPEDAVLVIEAA